MKNIFYLVIILLLGSSQVVFAQFEGKKFIAGSASILFKNDNLDGSKATNNYGYNVDISLGKFKTNTVASGWRFSTSLAGSRNSYQTYSNGSVLQTDKSGITGFGAGIGRFWHFYKHFNDKTGVYAGPNVDISYNDSKVYDADANSSGLIKNKTNLIQLSAGLSAGFYYKMSEKWWITANIAVSSPVGINYTISTQKGEQSDFYTKQKTVNYRFSPNFTFPSVGFGIRYFL